MKTIPKNNGKGKPKFVVTYYPGSPSARVALGQKTNDGWEFRTKSAVTTPGLITALQFCIDGFDNDGE